MDLRPSEGHVVFRADVRRFIADHGHLSPQSGGGRRKPDERTRAWQRLLIEQGYFGRWVPRDYGGFGADLDVLEEAIIAEEFAEAGLHPGIRDIGTTLLVPTLIEAGTPEQRARWIRPTLFGETVWCQGYSEPEAGSDLTSLKTSALVDGDHFVINGSKIWTTQAHYADMMILLCRTEPIPGRAGLSYLLLPMTSPGIEVRPIKSMTGKASFNEVLLTDVRLPIDQIVGARGEGWTIANITLKYERLTLGAADKASSRLTRIAQLMAEQEVDGRRLLDHPGYRDRFVRLQGEALAAKCHNWRLLTEAARGEDSGTKRLITKLLGSELAFRAAALATDVFGVAGLHFDPQPQGDEDEATRWYGDYMYDLGLIIGGGSSQIQKNIIAERGLGMPREPRLAKTEG